MIIWMFQEYRVGYLLSCDKTTQIGNLTISFTFCLWINITDLPFDARQFYLKFLTYLKKKIENRSFFPQIHSLNYVLSNKKLVLLRLLFFAELNCLRKNDLAYCERSRILIPQIKLVRKTSANLNGFLKKLILFSNLKLK